MKFGIERYIEHPATHTCHVIYITLKKINGFRNSDRLKYLAEPSSEEFYSQSIGTAEILIFVVLRVPLQSFYFT